MAQDGDTITYTYSDGTRISEDISTINEITIEYIDSAGGESRDSSVSGGNGGRVENVIADVSNSDTLYIWVSDVLKGRYYSFDPILRVDPIGGFSVGYGGGSSEVSILQTDRNDSNTEPFIAAAGGGGGAGGSSGSGFRGARGSVNEFTLSDRGLEPPLGGDGGAVESNGFDGEGAVSGHGSGVPIIDSGTTIKGGGSGSDTAGEIQITYSSASEPPTAPSNVQITSATTEDELTLDWDTVSDATGYYVYRAESSGSTKADYTQVADVSSPPYTDAGLEDGENYYYRVSSHD